MMAIHKSRSGPIRVFIVDDNEALRTRVSGLLGETCTVIAAVSDGPEALAMPVNLRPEVIVLDVSLSTMTGFEFAKRLRKESTAAIVFLTNYDDAEIVAAAQAIGASGYVLKSRMVPDLTLAVDEARAGRSFLPPVS